MKGRRRIVTGYNFQGIVLLNSALFQQLFQFGKKAVFMGLNTRIAFTCLPGKGKRTGEYS